MMEALNPRLMKLLLRKELREAVRDPGVLLVALVLPAALMLLMGFGMQMFGHRLPLAVVDSQPSGATQSFVSALSNTRYFTVQPYANLRDARQAVLEGRAFGAVWLRGDFSRRLHLGQHPQIGVFINGTNANHARIAEGYLTLAWHSWVEQYLADHGRRFQPPVALSTRFWFNPTLSSNHYYIPGAIVLIMTVVGTLSGLLIVAREKENGTLDQLRVSGASLRQTFLAKLITAFLSAYVGLLVCAGLATWVFHATPVGGWLPVLGFSVPLLLALNAMGMLISSGTLNQESSIQISLLVTFLPAFILSGFVFAIYSMPAAIRPFTDLIAARFGMAGLLTLFDVGKVASLLWWNIGALLLLALVFLLPALRNTLRRRKS